MAQKPVANALTLELEPVVEANMDRHLNTDDIWFAHDYVPFDRGENFAFLGGHDWDPSQMTLPRHFTDACEILLLLKDNLAAQQDVDNAQSQVSVTAAQVDVAAASVAQTQAQLHQAQTNLSYTDIISPIDGTVISRAVEGRSMKRAGMAAAAAARIATYSGLCAQIGK